MLPPDRARTLMLSLWLPIGVLVASLFRFDLQPSSLFSLPAMILGLVMAWPGGIPLTLALRRLHHHSRPLTYGCAAVLCPLSVGAATVGGLFGPIGHLDIRGGRLPAGMACALACDATPALVETGRQWPVEFRWH